MYDRGPSTTHSRGRECWVHLDSPATVELATGHRRAPCISIRHYGTDTENSSIGLFRQHRTKILNENVRMPNISQIFKSEISRVARKEVRQEIEGLRKASTHHRSVIAGLRREVAELQKRLQRLTRTSGKSPSQQVQEEDAAQHVARRFSPTRLASHRAKLGLSAALYGQLVGVSGQTIFHWEQGKARPRAAQLEALAAIRGIGKRDAEKRLEQAA